ncbi:tetratricopeptide repeat protein [Clostridium felsineum]|nr:tetratricopeptide repeat protein [Clostridium felsineum]
MNRVLSIFRKLSTIYVYNGKYKEGVSTCKYALSRFKMDDNYKAIFTFNMSMYYNYLKEYDKSLDVLLEAEDSIKKAFPDRVKDILLLKASSLHGVKHYAGALGTYTEILNSTEKNDYNNLCVYYNNMAEIYCLMGNTDIAKNYVQTVKSYLVKVSDDFKYLPQIYLGLGRVYIMLKEQDKGLELLLKALGTSKSFKYHSVTKDIINEFTGFNNEVTDIDIKEEFVILTEHTGFIDNKLLYNIMEYFSRLNKNDELISICKFCKKMA